MFARTTRVMASIALLGMAAWAAMDARADTPSQPAAPETATIPLKARPGNSGFHNFIPVGVGDGQPADMLLDTGSTGLRIRAEAVGPAVRLTDIRLTYSYSSGNVLNGLLGYAVVAFPGSTPPVATPKPIAIQVVQSVTCKPDKPKCPGWAPTQMGVMGVAYGPYQVFNPLAQLSGNLASGFIVIANDFADPHVTPHLDVGLTPANSDGFARAPFLPADRPQPDGFTAWNTKSIPTCFSVDAGPAGCFATVFDTGAGNGSFETPEIGPDQFGRQVPNGALVTTEVRGVMKLTIKAGSRVWIDRYRYAPPHGSVKGFNSGGVVFRYFRVLFDAVKGEIGFSPASSGSGTTLRPHGG